MRAIVGLGQCMSQATEALQERDKKNINYGIDKHSKISQINDNQQMQSIKKHHIKHID